MSMSSSRKKTGASLPHEPLARPAVRNMLAHVAADPACDALLREARGACACSIGLMGSDSVKDLKPLGDRLLVKVAEVADRTSGGVILSGAAEKPTIGEVRLGLPHLCQGARGPVEHGGDETVEERGSALLPGADSRHPPLSARLCDVPGGEH